MICNILPYNESYDIKDAGAIGLSVRDLSLKSKYQDNLHILGGTEAKEPLTFNYHKLPIKNSIFRNNSDQYIKAALTFIKSRPVELIELHNKPSWITQIKESTNIPIALHLHNNPQIMLKAQTKNERIKILMQCDAIYCVSHFIKNKMIEGVEEQNLIEKVHVVYNTSTQSQTVDLSSKQKIIMYVGRLTEEKGIIEFSEAIRHILPDNPEWKALIIASSSKRSILDPSYRAVMTAVKALPEQIIFHARCKNETVQSWLKNSSIAVLPSKWDEPFGRTILEAINNGCALITSNRGAIPEIVLDDAIVIESISSRAIENELIKFIQNEHLLVDYQRRALDRAAKFNRVDSAANLDFIRSEVIKKAA